MTEYSFVFFILLFYRSCLFTSMIGVTDTLMQKDFMDLFLYFSNASTAYLILQIDDYMEMFPYVASLLSIYREHIRNHRPHNSCTLKTKNNIFQTNQRKPTVFTVNCTQTQSTCCPSNVPQTNQVKYRNGTGIYKKIPRSGVTIALASARTHAVEPSRTRFMVLHIDAIGLHDAKQEEKGFFLGARNDSSQQCSTVAASMPAVAILCFDANERMLLVEQKELRAYIRDNHRHTHIQSRGDAGRFGAPLLLNLMHSLYLYIVICADYVNTKRSYQIEIICYEQPAIEGQTPATLLCRNANNCSSILHFIHCRLCTNRMSC